MRFTVLPTLLVLAALAALAAPAIAQDSGAGGHSVEELHGLAASCAAFHGAALYELDVPLEETEATRQDLIQVTDALSKKLLPEAKRKPWFQEHVEERTGMVTTLLQVRPEEAGPKVRENLDACAALLPEMRAAAGLD